MCVLLLRKDQQMSKSKDVRYYRTRERIYDALTTLLQKKTFTEITVKDIVEEGMVSRSAFYNHFEDKFHLIQEYQLEYLDQINHVINQTIGQGMHEMLLQVSTLLKREGRLFGLLLGKNGSTTIQENMIDLLKKNGEINILPYLDISLKNEIEKYYFLAFLSNAVLGVVQEWVKRDFKESPEEIVTVIEKIISYDIKPT